MELIIRDPNSAAAAKKRFDIHWKLAIKKRLIYFLIRPAYGLILILIGIFTYNSYNTTSYSVTKADGVHKHITYFNLNLFLAIGIVFILYFLLELVRVRRERNKLWGEELKKINKEIIIRVTDENVTHEFAGITKIIQWDRFLNYIEYQNFIFLQVNDSLILAVVINKNLLRDEGLKELMVFLNRIPNLNKGK